MRLHPIQYLHRTNGGSVKCYPRKQHLMLILAEREGTLPEKRYLCPGVQARTEHNKAGAHLTQTARTLESEAEEARKAVAAVLALDRADVYSSTQAWVLDKIGIGPSAENNTPAGTGDGGMEFASAGGLRGKEAPARVGVVQEAVMLAEVSHRRGHVELLKRIAGYIASVGYIVLPTRQHRDVAI